MSQQSPISKSARPRAPFASDDERYESFAKAIDGIRARVRVGEADLAHIQKVDDFSSTMEVVGRGLIHFSFEPVAFTAGVLALWLHKQLQATEVGHTVLHGCYDRLEGPIADRYRSKTFWWQIPIDEESWRYGHNVRHHQYTNVAGKDPDIHFGPVRLTPDTPHRIWHTVQIPLALGVIIPNFTFWMNWHFTGLSDLYFGNGRGGMDVLPDRSWESVKRAHVRALRKYLPYYGKEFVLFPLLAGPMFWKVALGNLLSEVIRDVYSAATVWCGHIGEEVAHYPEGTKGKGKGRVYAMNVEATNNFEVPEWVSILCGGLDRQIEHHLFPHLPPNRLREIAGEVREVCEAHGIRYRTASWGKTLKGVFRHLFALSSSAFDAVRQVA